MTRTLVVTALCAVALAGCGRTIVRETVVEKPGPVRETIVERPVVVDRPGVALAPPASCSYAGTPYAHGSLTCQEGRQQRCSNGMWERLPTSC